MGAGLGFCVVVLVVDEGGAVVVELVGEPVVTGPIEMEVGVGPPPPLLPATACQPPSAIADMSRTQRPATTG